MRREHAPLMRREAFLNCRLVEERPICVRKRSERTEIGIAIQMDTPGGSIHQRGTQPQPLLFLSQMLPCSVDACGTNNTLHPSTPFRHFVVCQQGNRNLIMEFFFASPAKEIARQGKTKSMAVTGTRTGRCQGEADSHFPTLHAVFVTTAPAL